jgi:RNA polymerase sigma-70 factor (ECF subfamily)
VDDSRTTAVINRLIERLGRGDAAARDELLKRAWGRLDRLTRKMLGGFPTVRRFEETGDILNASAVRLHNALKDVVPDSALHFFRLAAVQIRRELIDLARRYRARPPVVGRSPTTPSTGEADHGGVTCTDPPDGTTRDPSRLDRWTQFHEAVERLPEKPREAVDLLWYQELTQVEAADLLGVSVKTIKNRWMEARLLICDELGGEMPGEG